jgi:hypothetical protein
MNLNIKNISIRPLGFALASLLLSGCASTVWDEVNLMPAPDVYTDGRLDPLPDSDPMALVPYGGILYATDRRPAGEDDNENYYVNERGAKCGRYRCRSLVLRTTRSGSPA